MFNTLFLIIVPTLIVALSAQLAVTIVRHPSAELILARAQLRGEEEADEFKDDIGSRGKVIKILLIGVAISIAMSCLLGLMVWSMKAEWLISLGRWLESAISPMIVIVLVVILMAVGPTFRLVGCFRWLTKTRLAIVLAVQLVLVALWVMFDGWLLQDLLAAMMAMLLILQFQFRASFLRLSLVLLVAAFLYDAWQVYGTGNMTEYAQAVMPVQEAAGQERVYGLPALFVIPDGFAMHAKWVGMLGVGDVFVGGVMAVTALRVGRRIGTYAPFYAVVAAYAASLLCAVLVIRHFHVAQPATIYIVPLCMGAVMLWAWLSGRWAELKKPAFGRELYAPDKQEMDTTSA